VADFVEGLGSGKPTHPSFRDALETQRVCDAVLKSAKTGCFENVPNA
jgi:predicted dehydrogenase